MTKDFLSQDEIDALLRQGVVEDNGTQQADEELNDFERDALGEIGNISLGTAATALSTLLRKKVEITTPSVTTIRRENLQNDLPFPHVVIKVDYTDGFIGANVLAIQIRDAQVIADLMLGGDGNVTADELNELHMSAVAEAMNQMMGSAATSMSTIFNMMVNISPPSVSVLTLDETHAVNLFPADDVLVKVSFHLLVEDLIDSNMMQLIPFSFAKTMLAKLTGHDNAVSGTAASTDSQSNGANQQVADVPTYASQMPPIQPQTPGYGTMTEQPPAGYGMPREPMHAANYGIPPEQSQGAGYGMPMMQPSATGYGMPAGQPHPGYGMPPAQQQAAHGMMGGPSPYAGHPVQPAYNPVPAFSVPNSPGVGASVNVQPAQFAPFDAASPSVSSNGNMNLLLDIPLQVTVELGRTRKRIRDILELGPGTIIELDKLAGEPVDILVNNKLVAKGEVVVIDENFGVRVTDILSTAERIAKLQ